MTVKQRASMLRYGLAIVSVCLAQGIRLWVDPVFEDRVPFITFFAAIAITAFYGGFGPAVVSVILGGFLAAYSFVPPRHFLLPVTDEGWLALALFAFVGLTMGLLSELMHRAWRSAENSTEEIRRQRERFYITLASIGDAVIVTDTEGRIAFMNSMAEHMTAWTQTSAMGKPLTDVFVIVNESTREPAENPVGRVLRDGKVVGLANHTMLVARDGREWSIDDSAAPIREVDGQMIGVVLVFRDVSEKRRSEIECAQLAAVLTSSEDAIISHDLQGIVRTWNQGAEALYGFTSEETIGKPLTQTIVPPDKVDEWVQAQQSVLLGERVEPFETMRLRKDGSQVEVSVQVSAIYDPDDKIVGISKIDRDISARRASEQRRTARLAITQILSQQPDLEHAAPRFLEAICRSLCWDAGALWVYDADRQALHCSKLWHDPSLDFEEFRTATHTLWLEKGVGMPGRVWETGRPVWIPDVAQESNFPRAPLAIKAGLHAALGCPLVVGNDFLGIIEFFSREIQEPDEDMQELMATVAGQIGLFIERREAERQLLRSEQQLNDFFENAAVGLHWVGPDGTILRVNQTELTMLGYTREEFVGQLITKFYVDQPVIEDMLKRLNQGETIVNYKARMRCKDGSLKHVLVDSNGLWENGVFIHSRCIIRDVTDQRRAEEALRESEERLRLALGASEMGTWEWNIASGAVLWSTNLERIHGMQPNTFPGTFEAFEQDIHPEDRDRVLESVRRVVNDREEYRIEYRIVWPNGSVHWLETRGKLFLDENGNPYRMLGICADVTDRKRLEEELRSRVKESAANEERVRSVVNHVLDAIITIDDRGTMQTFNPAAERLFGWSAAEVIGQNVKILMPEPYHSGHDEYIAHYLRTGDARIMGAGREVEGRRRNGTTMPIELAVSEFRLGDKRFFTGILHDVTERKRTEATLRFLADASKLLSTLVDSKETLRRVAQLAVPDFADWCCVHLAQANGSLERLALVHSDHNKQQQLEEFLAQYSFERDAPYGPANVLRTGEAEILPEINHTIIRDIAIDETSLEFMSKLHLSSSLCVPLRSQGQTLGILTFAFAESGRHYGPEDMVVAEDLAHRAVIAWENARLYHEVREADRRKDEFLAMLAHELRNPLAPIRSGLDILAMEGDGSRETVDVMQRQMEHLIRLVDDLLDVSRIMRGKIDLRKEPVDFSDVVEQATETVRPAIESQGKTLEINMPDEPLWLDADRVRILQVLENLLNNASKYTDRGGHIQVSVKRREHEVDISVKDDGIGIDPELLPKIFDLFTQASRSLDRAQGGLGIGLTLVRNLVELHGGSVTARSEGLGKGTEFRVLLPLEEAPEVPKADLAPPPPVVEGRQILVVDDNVGAARMLSALINKLGSHTTRIAHDGPTAIAMAQDMNPDIVMLDIGLPGMDGFQVAQAIRESDPDHRILLVAVTGYGQEEDRRKTQAAGFDVHLVKPASFESIAQLLTLPKLGGDKRYSAEGDPDPAASSP